MIKIPWIDRGNTTGKGSWLRKKGGGIRRFALRQIAIGASWSILERRELHNVAAEIDGRQIVRVEQAAVRAERGGRRDELVKEVEGGHRLALLVPITHEEILAAADDRRSGRAPGGWQPENAMRLGRRRWETKGSGSTCLRLDSRSLFSFSFSLPIPALADTE